ncbi:MAG: ACT domain-containing protein [Planctomycetota bacterium]
MARVSLVLTVLGPDRPGLVEALSDTIKRHDANWLGSRMARLSGQFAGIVHVHADAAAADALTADLLNLRGRGLVVHVGPGEVETAAADREVPGRVLDLELLGQDRPGIVRDLAHALAARGINVAELRTATESAAMSGETLFRATACLEAPAAADLDELHDTLDRLAASLDLDLSLSDRPAATAT